MPFFAGKLVLKNRFLNSSLDGIKDTYIGLQQLQRKTFGLSYLTFLSKKKHLLNY